jgi:hypothetical protein
LQPLAPAVTSIITVVPSLFNILAQVGVMAATAVPLVIAFAVKSPDDAAGNAVAPNVRVTPKT